MQTAVLHTPIQKVLYIICIDTDECEQQLDNCHDNADCLDTVGSFDCECKSGFEGDGFNCTGK